MWTLAECVDLPCFKLIGFVFYQNPFSSSSLHSLILRRLNLINSLPLLFPNVEDCQHVCVSPGLAAWLPALQRAAAFLLCCFFAPGFKYIDASDLLTDFADGWSQPLSSEVASFASIKSTNKGVIGWGFEFDHGLNWRHGTLGIPHRLERQCGDSHKWRIQTGRVSCSVMEAVNKQINQPADGLAARLFFFFFYPSPVALSVVISLYTLYLFSDSSDSAPYRCPDTLHARLLAATALLWNPPALLTFHISSLFLPPAGWKNYVWHYFSVPVENSGSIDLLAYTMFKCGSPLIREQSS